MALTIAAPQRFYNADRYGGIAVGIIVILAGVRVARETALAVDGHHAQRQNDGGDPRRGGAGARRAGHGECFARKTGLSYHVDLHLEVDPEMTVRQSHEIAHEVAEGAWWIRSSGWPTCWCTSSRRRRGYGANGVS